MAPEIDKKTLEHLAHLARIDLDSKEEERLLRDIRNIVAYVEELQSADTAGITPMNGGGDLENVFRDDVERENTNRKKGVELFPKNHEGFLGVPPVFE